MTALSSPLLPSDASAEPSEADLVALVGSRLCHDLISPLGAISNGVELLAMSGGAMSPEMQLIAESVSAANARVKFFRVAFGQANTEQRVSQNEIRSLLSEMSATGRTKFDWQVDGDQPRHLVKMAYLAILCMETALPFGGRLVITEHNGEWHLVAETRRTKPDDALWQALAGHAPADLRPAQVQFILLPREAETYGRHIDWQINETEARMNF
ncbi:histidine phosphotransferase family protein [Thioclava sp. GXIMD4216]|uniref:histidine phosphotransferase family protein n=1 Tax=Thioclava sp. GXIMD4216 TaxID=3131929 RepID=UPI0030D26DBB